MINPMFQKGDLVYIRKYEDVPAGERKLAPCYCLGFMSECGGHIYKVRGFSDRGSILLDKIDSGSPNARDFYWNEKILRKVDGKSYV